ncbi:hypothetical protein Goshw_006252 [Gossypium schwendimanii]|uniref:Uncharacterized protein n=1 Tax=Gossypium schwendimanii TaxID=34291 RepID=A0A7J9L1G9_GOSSC|nr:hypothetical protein [Gossypium schwendimanii]
MASSICLSLSPPSKTLARPSTSTSRGCRCCSVVSVSKCHKPTRRKMQQVICMAPEEEKLIRRNPLDFPIVRRRPNIFPQFSPMKTPLPVPMPYYPPEEDEEEEEDPEKEQEPENPKKQS